MLINEAISTWHCKFVKPNGPTWIIAFIKTEENKPRKVHNNQNKSFTSRETQQEALSDLQSDLH